MPTSRYDDREQLYNNDPLYKKLLKKRYVKSIIHYETPTFFKIEDEEYGDIETIHHVWKLGDRYSKLAEFYYSDPTLWWIIARFNEKPTESHLELGDLIFIPVPLEAAFEIFGV